MTKYILASAITVVVAIGLATQYHTSEPRSDTIAESDRQSSNETSTPYAESQRIFALGRVEGATREIQIRPQLDGRVDHVAVTEGQMVQAGDILIQLDDSHYRFEVESAIADVELAKSQLQRLRNGTRPQERIEAQSLFEAKLARLKNARRRLDRANQLFDASAIPKREVDDLQSDVESLFAEMQAARSHMETVQADARPDEVRIAAIRIKAAQAKLRLAKTQQDRMCIRAPQPGQVLKVNVEVGELTGPQSKGPAVILADTSVMKVRAFVEELNAPRVELGATARVTADGLTGTTYLGQVTALSPRMGHKSLWSDRPNERNDTKTREVMVTLTNREKLFVGMQVDVIIDVAAPNNE